MHRRILQGAALTAALAMCAAVPALAHEETVYHGNDFAQVLSGHLEIKGCDREPDGHAVRAQWRNSSGVITYGAWDTTADAVCANEALPSSAVEFRVCENDVGCSAWVNK